MAMVGGICHWSRAVACVAVAIFLATSGMLKVWSGHSEGIEIGRFPYYSLALVELALSVTLVVGGERPKRICLILVTLLCMVGVIWTSWYAKRPCGCLGSHWLLSNALHASLGATVGILCIFALVPSQKNWHRV